MAPIYIDIDDDPYNIDFSPLELVSIHATEVLPEVDGEVAKDSPSEPWPLRIASLKGEWVDKIRLIAKFKRFLLSLKLFLTKRREKVKDCLVIRNCYVSVSDLIDAETCLIKGIQQQLTESAAQDEVAP